MSKKVLIVDDDARNIFALEAILRSRQYSCMKAGTVQQALALLQNNDEVGIILIDMMMPGMDGYEGIPEIKKRYRIPVIAVTAQAMLGDKEKCLEAGADDYVSKPIDFDRLLQILDTYLKN